MITEFMAHTGVVNIVQFHPNEYMLASGSSDRFLPPHSPPLFTHPTSKHSNRLLSLAFLSVCVFVLSRTVKLWDLEKFKMIGSSEGETGAVR